MDEKLKCLKEYLPDFLNSNKSIYGILSAGIHSLDKESCKKYFPVIKNSIKMILEEEVSISEKEKLVKDTSKNLQIIVYEIKE